MSNRQEITLIQGKPVRYRVRRSQRARRLTLEVDKRNGLVVVLPARVARREVFAMLQEHAVWIDRQVERFGVRFGPQCREYASGSELLFLGRARRLEIEPLAAGRKRSVLRLDGDTLHARLAPRDVLEIRPVLERWLRRQARRIFAERVAFLSDRIGLTPGKVIVGERISRWGSCSGRGTLSFCYRLVLAPPPVVDAIVAHEICHLRHGNHGRRFWRLLRLACPGYDEQMAWLRAHEDDLHL